ncbi:transmembrane protein, putative [Medicago truncatula]|uniref:Transmembrane protein, putative n=1 Tax=Medicago truncatula TaxID=3880 RepID=A0A072UF02_MEDTR|nr:transmembrane protein, putative [Medicago truncatula]
MSIPTGVCGGVAIVLRNTEGEQGLQMQKPFTQQLGYPEQTLAQLTMRGHSKGPLASTGFPKLAFAFGFAAFAFGFATFAFGFATFALTLADFP